MGVIIYYSSLDESKNDVRLLGCENGIVVGGAQNTGRGRFDGQHHSLLRKGLQIIEQNMLSPISTSSTFLYLLCAPTIS